MHVMRDACVSMITSTVVKYSYCYPYPSQPPVWPRRNKSCVIPAHQRRPVPDAEYVGLWLISMRSPPTFEYLPDVIIERIASFCLEPASLLNLSSTCRRTAALLRTIDCWLDHHAARDYDITVLKHKAHRASRLKPDFPYGRNGWGILVRSAFDKFEFPDDEWQTQCFKGKRTPHVKIPEPDAITKYQPRGEYYMRVMYNLITEHEFWNLQRHKFLGDEAMCIRVKSSQGRLFQALICASHFLMGLWIAPLLVLNSIHVNVYVQHTMTQILAGIDNRYTLSIIESLTYSLLCLIKCIVFRPSQEWLKLYPFPPMGPDIWQDADGDINPQGLGWVPRVKEIWQGEVFAMGTFVKTTKDPHPQAVPSMPNLPLRLYLNFMADGTIVGRGGDYGGFFTIRGNYRKLYVSMVKEYNDDEADMYYATGHMLPWGLAGRWANSDDEELTVGYWYIWVYEGAPKIPWRCLTNFEGIGDVLHPVEPYSKNPNWFFEYEEAVRNKRHRERHQGWFIDKPALPENTPLPPLDAFGL